MWTAKNSITKRHKPLESGGEGGERGEGGLLSGERGGLPEYMFCMKIFKHLEV